MDAGKLGTRSGPTTPAARPRPGGCQPVEGPWRSVRARPRSEEEGARLHGASVLPETRVHPTPTGPRGGSPPEPRLSLPDHDFQLLTTCGDASEAALVRSLLEADNIPCIIQGEQHRSMLGVAGAYIELRVLVPARELEHARELLKSVSQEEPPPGVATSAQDDGSEEAHCALHGQRATRTCERCGTFLCDSCEGASAGLCEDCAERNGSGAEIQRGRKRKVVAWLILLFLFGPPFLLMLASTLNALLQ
ncbi:putative signal transducing protein [Corallococcus aberystwythensis]|uniref:DUF2007 domain-containing protein n=1 Tax=Corallococcus aberystwythensis TaxID=2316722 RepID=A0A3A8PXW2_9BACT|nr:DUF2007 domain-containing protein [Corallococcus aberystwythensis]RKH61326.1 DUF2007 domain-containing protein [Corallococcus aberystwythensis]